PGRINSLYEDSARVLWIGSDSGLAYLKDGRVRVPRRIAGMLQGQVTGISSDDSCCLWVATTQQVARLDRAQLLEDSNGTVALREFGPSDGIPAPEGIRRHRTVAKDSTGRIWFSLRGGISVVEPARATSPSVPAIVGIDSVLVDGNPMDP